MCSISIFLTNKSISCMREQDYRAYTRGCKKFEEYVARVGGGGPKSNATLSLGFDFRIRSVCV